MHPESISKEILPGNFVLKMNRNGVVKKRYTELVYGYFWMLRDLRQTDDKPILSNVHLISETLAKPFPALQGLRSLSNVQVDVPDFLVRKNRSMDAHAQVTVVAISFRDYGYQLASTWIGPIKRLFLGNDRAEVIRINVSEGWWNKWVLRPIIRTAMKRNTAGDEYGRTLLYFGSTNELEPFRDALRMHNSMTGYIFLLDGIGRVRFAGSGAANEDEIDRLAMLAEDLLTAKPLPAKGAKKTAGSSRKGR